MYRSPDRVDRPQGEPDPAGLGSAPLTAGEVRTTPFFHIRFPSVDDRTTLSAPKDAVEIMR
jgi:hypothetical protein